MADAHIEQVLRQRLVNEPRVLAANLFGSVARGDHRPGSDVDVALLHQRTPEGYLAQPFDLEADLSELLGRTVQVVAIDRAPADLVHRVLCDGVLLVDKDPARRIAFEVRSRNEYFDMLPIWRRYRRSREHTS
jgi:predicted nucleotidyltransferase